MKNKNIIMSLAVVLVLFTGCNEEKEKIITDTKEIKVESKEVSKKEQVAKPQSIEPKTVMNEVKEIKVPETKITLAIDGSKLYTKCMGCHGKNGEKSALSKSKVIKGWQSSKISEALKGYKSGTYGGAMKSLMQSQVKSLSTEEIDLLAEHISSF